MSDFYESKIEELTAGRDSVQKRILELKNALSQQVTRLNDIDKQIRYLRQLGKEHEQFASGTYQPAMFTEMGPDLPRSSKEALLQVIDKKGEELLPVADLIEEVLRLYPTAKRNTIMVDLHYAYKRGNLERVRAGVYRKPSSQAKEHREDG